MSSDLINVERLKQWKQSRFNPIRMLTPVRLAEWLDAFESGDLRSFALLADVVADRDDILSTVIPKRVGAVARRRVEILTVDGLDPSMKSEAERHREALSYFYNNLRCTNALNRNERGGLGLLIRQMLRGALCVQYAVHEIIWRPSPEGLTGEFNFVPLWFFENRTGQLRFLKSESAYEGEELEPDRWMVTTGPGLMKASSIAFLYKRFGLTDWLDYNERYGKPLPVGKTDASPDSPEWKALAEAVRSIGNDWAAVMSRSSEIVPLDLKSQGQSPFPMMVETMNRALTRIWRGADLSTMSAERGQGQGASLQGDEAFLMECDDADIATGTLNEYVDRFVIRYVFGEDVEPLAYAKVVIPERRDIDRDLRTDEFLISQGARLSLADALERYSRTEADEDEPALGDHLADSPSGEEGEANLPPAQNASGANEGPRGRSLPHQAGKTAGRPPHSSANGSRLGRLKPRNPQKGLPENGVEVFAASLASDLAPVRRRLQAIAEIPDPEIQRARLVAFLAEFDTLKQSILADPESSLALAKIQAAGVLGGLLSKS